MSNIKVGDKVKVRNSGRGVDGWVGDVEKIDKKIIYVRFKEEGYSLSFYGEELEVIATPPTQTKMLHELITLAKAGVKFKAKQGETILDSCGYTLNANSRWTTDEVLTPWQYEEIKEPRVVEFEADWTAAKHDDVLTMGRGLAGAKWKIVATEVIK